MPHNPAKMFGGMVEVRSHGAPSDAFSTHSDELKSICMLDSSLRHPFTDRIDRLQEFFINLVHHKRT